MPDVKQMNLAFDLSYLHLEGRWRAPGSFTGETYPSLRILSEIASIAERGCIDMLFFGDGVGIPSTYKGTRDEAVRWGIGWPRQDMSPYIAALAQQTRHIGFGLTYSSTFMHPFYTARLLNSLDHITNGRIAFNVVTSTRPADAANYGFDELMEHGQRYARMIEFVDICKALWASVEPDALVWDRETGIVADPEKVHAINYVGEFFKVAGPLPCAPSPQGRPILIQAGGSPTGIKASAHFADLIFGGGGTLERLKAHRAALDAALVEEGRDPEKVGILWSVPVVVDETDEEAIRRHMHSAEALSIEAYGVYLSHNVGYDLSTIPDRFTVRELQDIVAATGASPVGVTQLAKGIPEDTPMNKRDFLAHCRDSRKDTTFVGSARKVADKLEEIFEATGERGGFMMSSIAAAPREVLNVIDYLVPELQRRGRFRTRYTGRTLRENLANHG
jgi:FMN-dependent oxidoreductase (nitrilotriacetate monooxygenase family)